MRRCLPSMNLLPMNSMTKFLEIYYKWPSQKAAPRGGFWSHEPWTANFKSLLWLSLTMKAIVNIWISRFMVHETIDHRVVPPLDDLMEAIDIISMLKSFWDGFQRIIFFFQVQNAHLGQHHSHLPKMWRGRQRDGIPSQHLSVLWGHRYSMLQIQI